MSVIHTQGRRPLGLQGPASPGKLSAAAIPSTVPDRRVGRQPPAGWSNGDPEYVMLWGTDNADPSSRSDSRR